MGAAIAPYWDRYAKAETAIRFGDLGSAVHSAWRERASVEPIPGQSQYGAGNQMIQQLKQSGWWGGLNLFATDEPRIKAFAKSEARRFDALFSNVKDVTDTERLQAAYLGCEPYQVTALNFGGGAWLKAILLLQEYKMTLDIVYPYHGKDGRWETVLRGRLSLVKRLSSWRWWQRRAKTAQKRLIEETQRAIGLVNASRALYVSDNTFSNWQASQRQSLDLLEKTEIENDLGQRFNLAELFHKSVSNPAIRRIELMTRVSGLEKLAESLGYQATFVTLTCPSRFHAYSYRKNKKGKSYAFKNKSYAGATVREAQLYLRSVWAEIRADLGRLNADFFGIRVAEPHHDGCPHWHLLIFTRSDFCGPIHPEWGDQAQAVGITTIEQVIERHALKDSGTERGASKSRVTFERIKQGINPKTGRIYSAIGYLAKYISKNIDGIHIDKTEYGTPAKTSAQRVRAWASCHGVRQFQTFGGVPVTHWRELRRLGAMYCKKNKAGEMVLDTAALVEAMEEKPELSELFMLVLEIETEPDKSVAYFRLCQVARSQEVVISTLTNVNGFVSQVTGEVTDCPVNEYGEPAPTIKGLLFLSHAALVHGFSEVAEVITRPFTWRLVTKAPERFWSNTAQPDLI